MLSCLGSIAGQGGILQGLYWLDSANNLLRSINPSNGNDISTLSVYSSTGLAVLSTPPIAEGNKPKIYFSNFLNNINAPSALKWFSNNGESGTLLASFVEQNETDANEYGIGVSEKFNYYVFRTASKIMSVVNLTTGVTIANKPTLNSKHTWKDIFVDNQNDASFMAMMLYSFEGEVTRNIYRQLLDANSASNGYTAFPYGSSVFAGYLVNGDPVMVIDYGIYTITSGYNTLFQDYDKNTKGEVVRAFLDKDYLYIIGDTMGANPRTFYLHKYSLTTKLLVSSVLLHTAPSFRSFAYSPRGRAYELADGNFVMSFSETNDGINHEHQIKCFGKDGSLKWTRTNTGYSSACNAYSIYANVLLK